MRAEKNPDPQTGALPSNVLAADQSLTPILTEPASVYAEAFGKYRDAGWLGVLPVPARQKQPVPPGYTGRDGAWPSYSDCYAWAEDYPAGNVALRLPPDVIGIDVDHYDGKDGGGTLEALVAKYGPLPPTWTTGSRDDGVSGIRLYRVPEGLAWPGDLGGGIEVIQRTHRYAIVWPSIHPATGRTYVWTGPDGADAVDGFVPSPGHLPLLPAEWVQALAMAPRVIESANLDAGAVSAWLTSHGAGPPCRRMDQAARDYAADLGSGKRSRHDTAKDAAMRICHLAAEGHAGAGAALATVRAVFLDAVAGDRRPGEAAAEWDRLLGGAVGIAAARQATAADPCADPLSQLDGLIALEDRAGVLGALEVYSGPATAGSVAGPVQPAAQAEVQDNYSRAVADRVLQLRVQDDAARLFRQQRAGQQDKPSVINLADFLDQPDGDTAYRIDQLWPLGGRVVNSAQYKSGKSTQVGNVIRSLVDGDPFLGRFATVPAASVVLIDNELDENTLRRWFRAQGIRNQRAVRLIPLRGKVSTFDILDPMVRQEWAQIIQGAEVVILDCLRPVLDALGLSEDKDAGRFLVAFDALLDMAGARDAMVVHHMGHNGERSRGDSRILDWPDATWKLVRETDEPDSARYMSAFGRDVALAESRLDYDPESRRLTIGEGSRKQGKAVDILDDVLAAVKMHPGISQNGVEKFISGDSKTVRAALGLAVERGLMLRTTRAGRGGGYAYTLK